MDLSKYQFATEMSVRDYEIDYEGIVNNANYLHYLEHTRHEFCRWKGTSFAELHGRGVDPVLSRVEIDYISPLRMNDKFYSCLNLRREGPRFVFQQDIFALDGRAILKANVIVACVENGHLTRGDVLAEAFGM